MFGFGILELAILGGLFVALFGLRRVPQAARELGRLHGLIQRIKAILHNPFRFFR
jgi:Sec-independent protein translocase protein TatA